jgi:ABC-type transporter Mla maintaining outer membrane lipid asymmetry ATPase subunit MlaF
MEDQQNVGAVRGSADGAAAGVPAVSVRNLRMGYGSRVLLENATFDVHPREIVVVLGGDPEAENRV